MSAAHFVLMVAGLAGYVALGRALIGGVVSPLRVNLFALLNVGAVWLIFYRSSGGATSWLVCLALLVAELIAVRVGQRHPLVATASLLLPIAALLVVKVLARQMSNLEVVGISYLSFRLTHLALEVRNGTQPAPTLGRYFSFALFLPTLVVGPISPYSTFARSLDQEGRPAIALGTIVERLAVGSAKYFFFAPILLTLGYRGLLMDGHPHPPVDALVAAVAYYLHIYCNFSGFCDLALGGAALMGIRVAENFDLPLVARNPKDFWNRWHITLSSFMRDTVFTPLSKSLTRIAGPRAVNHAIAAAIFTVFLLIGIWHGFGVHYLLFGLVHGLGVVGNHYYTLFLKRRLGVQGFRAYMSNRFVKAVCVTLTFLFVSASFFVFANDLTAMRRIRDALVDPQSFEDSYVPIAR
jgi:membrane protein involved in D-alanine export